MHKSRAILPGPTNNLSVHSRKPQIQPKCTNMNANTYTSNDHPYILWSHNVSSLCLIIRQPGARRGLAALFACAWRTINRDIHRFWGEGFLALIYETQHPTELWIVRIMGLLFAGFLRRLWEGGFRNRHDVGKGVLEPLKRGLTRLSGWGMVLRGFRGHGSLRVRYSWQGMPSASCTLARGGSHV